MTAGVLRGAQSRFQLFGDTVNTASRMESTGVKGRIQCSQSTAESLAIAGKEHWVRAREDTVTAKGKGVLKVRLIIITKKQINAAHTNTLNDDLRSHRARPTGWSPTLKLEVKALQQKIAVGVSLKTWKLPRKSMPITC